ncbi:MAG: chitinase [Lachnospiraceae bacterium]|nr:chitinase [Lachnospiraceae bacterium]
MGEKKVLAYVVGDSIVTEEQARILTHIHVAFGHITMEGELLSNNHPFKAQMEQLRQWNPELKILLSIVPRVPDAFTVVSASEELRANVTKSCRRLVEEEGFDGVDFDWEYPCVPSNNVNCCPDDRHNFTLLCRAARKGLDEAGGGLLSIAAGADIYYIESVEPKPLAEVLDYVCLMTYDLKCGFHALTGHHTALYSSTGDIFRNSCDQALRLFEGAGFPKDKLLMGAAFYSRQWKEVRDRCHGFLQYTKSGGGYGPEYHELAADYIDKNGYVRYWDDEAKAPYLFNGSTFISYDDETSIACKCAYVNREEIGGIFYWNHSNDRSGALLKAIGNGMK